MTTYYFLKKQYLKQIGLKKITTHQLLKQTSINSIKNIITQYILKTVLKINKH